MIVFALQLLCLLSECTVKIIGLRHHYFTTAWNLFDFVLVIASIVGIVMEDLMEDHMADHMEDHTEGQALVDLDQEDLPEDHQDHQDIILLLREIAAAQFYPGLFLDCQQSVAGR